VGGFDAKDLVFATSFPSVNTIESITIVSHQFTRSRKIYHNKQSALKILYMAIHAVSKRWTMPIRQWKQAQNHSAILYEDRMPELTSK
jgi:transposase-like protein